MRAASAGLFVALTWVSPACSGGRSQPVTIAVELVEVVHAPQVAVPWWWRGGQLVDEKVCAQLDAGAFAALGDAVEPAVVAIDRGSLRLAREVVTTLDAGRLPPTQITGGAIGPLVAPLAAAVTRQRDVLRACGHADAPVDLLLAVAPDVPSDTSMLALHTAATAGVDRYFLAASGAGGPTWRPEGFSPEEEKVVLRWDDGWKMDLGRRSPRAPLAALDLLAQHLGAAGLGCATLPPRAGPWATAVADLDLLAKFGARRFSLEALPGPPGTATSTPGRRVELRVGAPVAAFPIVPLKLVDIATVPNWEADGWNGMHPCEGIFVQRATLDDAMRARPPTSLEGDPNADPWQDLPP